MYNLARPYGNLEQVYVVVDRKVSDPIRAHLNQLKEQVESVVEFSADALSTHLKTAGGGRGAVLLLHVSPESQLSPRQTSQIQDEATNLPLVVMGSGPGMLEKANNCFGHGNFYYLDGERMSFCLLLDTLQTALRNPCERNRKVEHVLSKNESTLRQFIASHPDGMMILNRTGIVLYANGAAHDILGLEEDKLIDKYFQIPASFEHLQKIIVPREGKAPIPLMIRKTRLRWQNQLAYWVTFQDVSGFYNKMNALEREKQRAEERSLSKTMMISNMSHEIRTPLTSILGYAEILSDGNVSELEKNHAIGCIQSNGQSLLRIVNDVLDIEKIEAGQISLAMELTTLDSLLKEIHSQLQAIERSPGVELSIEPPPKQDLVFETDVVRLKQILLNLMANALKFTSVGSVSLHFDIQSGSGNQRTLRFWIQDTGNGIPKEKWEEVFTPFVQLGNATGTRGSGLGLALARNLARKLGGDVRVKTSSPLRGTCFEVTIQARQIPVAPNEGNTADFSTDTANIDGTKILLVDDCEDILNLFSFQLSRYGAKVVSESRPDRVETLVAQNEFDIVLLDLRLGDADGSVIAADLRKKGYKKPIFALSADAISMNNMEQTSYAAFDKCLTKPIPIEKLIQEISTIGPANQPLQ